MAPTTAARTADTRLVSRGGLRVRGGQAVQTAAEAVVEAVAVGPDVFYEPVQDRRRSRSSALMRPDLDGAPVAGVGVLNPQPGGVRADAVSRSGA